MRVLVCDPLPEEAIDRMQQAGLSVEIRTGLSPSALAETIRPFHAVLVRSATRITAEIIAAGENLRVIGRAGVGLDNVDAAAARARDVAVVNTPGATSASVAELVIALCFALARKLPQAHAATAAGRWEKKAFEGTELSGKTMGLIGFGRIAKETAKRARALGMQVLCHRKDPAKHDPEARLWEVEIVTLAELLARSDFVSLHVPLSSDTKGLLGAAELARMKRGAFLVNCARGDIVDERALAAALADGQLAGAAVDVFSAEPVRPENPLLSAPNVVLTPHIGASAREGQLRAGLELADAVIRLLR